MRLFLLHPQIENPTLILLRTCIRIFRGNACIYTYVHTYIHNINPIRRDMRDILALKIG